MAKLQFGTISDAMAALRRRQVPSDQIPQVRNFIQDRYSLLRRQGFWAKPENAGFGHLLRQQGFVVDSSQGRAGAPVSAPVQYRSNEYGELERVPLVTDQYGELSRPQVPSAPPNPPREKSNRVTAPRSVLFRNDPSAPSNASSSYPTDLLGQLSHMPKLDPNFEMERRIFAPRPAVPPAPPDPRDRFYNGDITEPDTWNAFAQMMQQTSQYFGSQAAKGGKWVDNALDPKGTNAATNRYFLNQATRYGKSLPASVSANLAKINTLFDHPFEKLAGSGVKFVTGLPSMIPTGAALMLQGGKSLGAAGVGAYYAGASDQKNANEAWEAAKTEGDKFNTDVNNNVAGGDRGAPAKIVHAAYYAAHPKQTFTLKGKPVSGKDLALATVQNVIDGAVDQAANDPVMFAANVYGMYSGLKGLKGDIQELTLSRSSQHYRKAQSSSWREDEANMYGQKAADIEARLDQIRQSRNAPATLSKTSLLDRDYVAARKAKAAAEQVMRERFGNGDRLPTSPRGGSATVKPAGARTPPEPEGRFTMDGGAKGDFFMNPEYYYDPISGWGRSYHESSLGEQMDEAVKQGYPASVVRPPMRSPYLGETFNWADWQKGADGLWEPRVPSPEPKIGGASDLSAELVGKFGLLKHDADAVAQVADARAAQWSKATGYPKQSWYQKTFQDIVQGSPPNSRSSASKPGGPANTLFQGDKGAVQFQPDGRAVMMALEKPDITTVVHELSHIYRRELRGAHLKNVESWIGVENGQWTRPQEEAFANAFVDYLRDGSLPNKKIAPVFSQLKSWMGDIRQTLKTGQKNPAIQDSVREAFDHLLANPNGPPPGSPGNIGSQEAPAKAGASSVLGGDLQPRYRQEVSEALARFQARLDREKTHASISPSHDIDNARDAAVIGAGILADHTGGVMRYPDWSAQFLPRVKGWGKEQLTNLWKASKDKFKTWEADHPSRVYSDEEWGQMSDDERQSALDGAQKSKYSKAEAMAIPMNDRGIPINPDGSANIEALQAIKPPKVYVEGEPRVTDTHPSQIKFRTRGITQPGEAKGARITPQDILRLAQQKETVKGREVGGHVSTVVYDRSMAIPNYIPIHEPTKTYSDSLGVIGPDAGPQYYATKTRDGVVSAAASRQATSTTVQNNATKGGFTTTIVIGDHGMSMGNPAFARAYRAETEYSLKSGALQKPDLDAATAYAVSKIPANLLKIKGAGSYNIRTWEQWNAVAPKLSFQARNVFYDTIGKPYLASKIGVPNFQDVLGGFNGYHDIPTGYVVSLVYIKPGQGRGKSTSKLNELHKFKTPLAAHSAFDFPSLGKGHGEIAVPFPAQLIYHDALLKYAIHKGVKYDGSTHNMMFWLTKGSIHLTEMTPAVAKRIEDWIKEPYDVEARSKSQARSVQTYLPKEQRHVGPFAKENAARERKAHRSGNR